jgi:hypothetical protein
VVEGITFEKLSDVGEISMLAIAKAALLTMVALAELMPVAPERRLPAATKF